MKLTVEYTQFLNALITQGYIFSGSGFKGDSKMGYLLGGLQFIGEIVMPTQKSGDPFLRILEVEGGSVSHDCCLQPSYLIPGQQKGLFSLGPVQRLSYKGRETRISGNQLVERFFQ